MLEQDNTEVRPQRSQRSMWQLLEFLRVPLRREWKAVVVVLFAGWGKFLLPLTIPWATGRIIDVVLDHERLADPLQRTAQMEELRGYALLIAVVLCVLVVATYFRHAVATQIQAHITHHLRRRLFFHMQRLSMAFFARHHAGALGARASSDINHAAIVVDKGLIQYALDGVTFLLVAGVMIATSPTMSVVALSCMLFSAYLLWHFTPPIRQQSKWIQEGQSSVTGRAAELLAGISVVKAFAGERESGRSFSALSTHVVELQERNARLQGRFHAVNYTLQQLTTAIVVFLGAWLLITSPEALSKGELVAFLLYVGVVGGTVQRMVDSMMQVQEGFAALDRIQDIMTVLPEPADDPSASTPPISGALEVRDLVFAYPGRDPALKGLSHRFQAGRSYALVGPSGSGKSTLTQLLLRFYDPQSGQVLVDGHDLRSIRQDHYRSAVAVVLQEPILFSGTIAENIGFAVRDADRGLIEAAARKAQAHDFILELPDAYDTRVGERGLLLSGGQRQRIAIARALMRSPKVLILDEATSALDTATERSIQEVLDALQGQLTMIVIAHRLSTVRNVDEILVLADGRVVETGSWTELEQQGGLFAGLLSQQHDGRAH